MTGRPAFAAQHVLALLGKILRDEPPPLSDLIPGAPKELEAIITGMLKKDPAARLGDAALIADALGQVGAPPRDGMRSVELTAPPTHPPPRGSLVSPLVERIEVGDHFYTTDPSGELAPTAAATRTRAPLFHTRSRRAPRGRRRSTAGTAQAGPSSFYTTDLSKASSRPGFRARSEGILGHVATSPAPRDGCLLHRWWSAERADPTSTRPIPPASSPPHVGYKYEGVAAYVLPAIRTTSRGTLGAGTASKPSSEPKPKAV